MQHSNIALVQYYLDYVETTFRYCTYNTIKIGYIQRTFRYSLKIAIEIIYVEAAFRYCTHSTFEIIHVKTIFSYCTCRCYQDNLCPDSIQLLHFQSYGVINDKFNACSFEEGHMLDKAPYVF